METTHQQNILLLLAKEWRYTGPPGILDISDIVAAVGQAPSDTFTALKSLFEDGLVDMNQMKSSAFLTPEGFEAVESLQHGLDTGDGNA